MAEHWQGKPSQADLAKVPEWRTHFAAFRKLAQKKLLLSQDQLTRLDNGFFLLDLTSVLYQFILLLENDSYAAVLAEIFKPAENFTEFFQNSGRMSFFRSLFDQCQKYVRTINESVPLTTDNPAAEQLHQRMRLELLGHDTRTKLLYLGLVSEILASPYLFELVTLDYQDHPGQPRLQVWNSVFPHFMNLNKFFKHPRFPEFQQKYPLKDQLRVFTYEYDRRYIDPLFWIEEPVLFQLAVQLTARIPQPEKLGWGDRRVLFQLLMAAVGRHGVTDSELMAEIFHHWQPDPQPYIDNQKYEDESESSDPEEKFYQHYSALDSTLPPDERKQQALEQLSPPEQQRWLSQIYNGDPVEPPPDFSGLQLPQLQHLRREIRQRKGVSESLRAKELTPEMEPYNWIEDAWHPLHQYFGLGGWEIEAGFPADMAHYSRTSAFYRLVGEYSYACGNDQPIELAPNPHTRHETSAAVLHDQVDAGLLDLHAETTHSLHLNQQVTSPHHMAILIRLQFLCGRGCHPLFAHEAPKQANGEVDTHTLFINAKTSEPQHNVPHYRRYYCETKGLRLTTAEELIDMRRVMSMLGSAAYAYERALLFLKKVNLHELRTTKLRLPRLNSEDFTLIRDPTLRQLAMIWQQFCDSAQTYTTQPGIGMSNYWQMSIPDRDNVSLGKTVRAVFPTPEHHDDPASLETRIIRRKGGIFFKGRNYPNMLAGARALTEYYVQETDGVLTHHFMKFRNELQRLVDSASNPSVDLKARRDGFLLRFYHSAAVSQLSEEERQQLFEKLQQKVLVEQNQFDLPV